MKHQYEYTIGSQFLYALEYGDKNLTTEEKEQLSAFRAALPEGLGVWDYSELAGTALCDICGRWGVCYGAVYEVTTNE